VVSSQLSVVSSQWSVVGGQSKKLMTFNPLATNY